MANKPINLTGLSKSDLIAQNMLAPYKINTDAMMKIQRARTQFDPDKHNFKCTCCGKGYVTQKNNFHKTESPLYQSNNGYLPWCKECTEKYYKNLVSLYSENEEHAIEHFCIQADWVYEIEPLKGAKKSGDRSRLSSYASRKNLNVEQRKTYTDTLKHNYEMEEYDKETAVIVSKEQIKEQERSIAQAAIDRWGIGFTEMDYKNLDEHYKMLKKNNPNADNNQEIFIKNLCNINMLQIRALQNSDSKEYAALVKQYTETFKQAGLRTIEEKDNSNNEVFGVTLATISEYTPEEFYKDKHLYEDYDELGDYYDRHICRPMKNLMFNEDVRDKEFYVPDEIEEE